LLRRSADIPYSTTAGVMLAERVTDLCTLLTLLAISGTLALGSSRLGALIPIREAGLLLLGIFVLGLLGARVVGRPVERFMPGRIRPHFILFRAGAWNALRPGGLPLILACSLATWSLSAIRLYLVCRALGLIGINGPVVVFAAASIGLLLVPSITPGGLGVVETGLAALLLLAGEAGLVAGLDADLAVSVAILDRSISYWSVVVVGSIVYALSSLLPNRRTDRAAEPVEPSAGPRVEAEIDPHRHSELKRAGNSATRSDV
jgi:uncharacterized membrane protein YbhN (UPF0104 family)